MEDFSNAPALEAPLEGTPSLSGDTGSAAVPAAPAAVAEYEVKVDGQTIKVPLDELLKGYSRTSTFTRRMQEIAQDRQQFAQTRAAVERAREMLQNPDLVEAHLRQLRGNSAQQSQPTAADELLTAAQVQQMLAQERAQWQQQLNGGLAQIEVARMTNDYRGKIESHLDRVLGANSAIESALPNARGVLKAIVRAAEPRSLEEAVAMIDEHAAAMNRQLGGYVDTRLKAGPSTALSNGIEPPNGTSPGPTPNPTFNKVTDPRLRALVEEDLRRLMGGQ